MNHGQPEPVRNPARPGPCFPGELVLPVLWGAPDRSERLALGALYLGRISAAPALQIQVLADRLIEQTHRP